MRELLALLAILSIVSASSNLEELKRRTYIELDRLESTPSPQSTHQSRTLLSGQTEFLELETAASDATLPEITLSTEIFALSLLGVFVFGSMFGCCYMWLWKGIIRMNKAPKVRVYSSRYRMERMFTYEEEKRVPLKCVDLLLCRCCTPLCRLTLGPVCSLIFTCMAAICGLLEVCLTHIGQGLARCCVKIPGCGQSIVGCCTTICDGFCICVKCRCSCWKLMGRQCGPNGCSIM